MHLYAEKNCSLPPPDALLAVPFSFSMKTLLAALALIVGPAALFADVDPVRLPPTRPGIVAPTTVTPPAATPSKSPVPKSSAKKHAKKHHKKHVQKAQPTPAQ